MSEPKVNGKPHPAGPVAGTFEDLNRESVKQRASTLFQQHWNGILCRTDRLFAALLLTQWLAGIVVAAVVSPRTWVGDQSLTHIHLWMAVILGGILVSLPVFLVVYHPGRPATRYVIAGTQMLFSALLIHLTGGRIETHFHIFGSLAFLFFYRDWKVYVPATVVTVLDHLIRGIVYPQSIFGVMEASPWRAVEHAWWVVFELLFLIPACLQAQTEMWDMANDRARLEVTNSSIEDSIRQRTEELEKSREEMASTVQALSSVIGQVQLAGIKVAGASNTIGATARQQQASIAEQASAATEIMATSRQISATARELVATMGEVAHSADQTSDLAGQGNQDLLKMQERMGLMVETSASIVSKLAVLSEKASNINSVITTITKVADQTNLLSLNAAIEAEKAGEHGRGFGVVATEIRRLADQTAVATLDIERMVTEMQSAVAAGVMGMDKFREDVRQSDDAVNRVVDQLTRITERVQEMNLRFEQVNTGMQNQAMGAEQISESIGQLSEAAQQTAGSVREFTDVIGELQEATDQLQSTVNEPNKQLVGASA